MTRPDDQVCRAFGRQHITPAAGAAARAVFLSCGGATGWHRWTTRSGKFVGLVLASFASRLEETPDAPAEALYQLAVDRHWHGPNPLIWAELPPAVRAAHIAFRAVWLEIRAQVAEAERQETRPARFSDYDFARGPGSGSDGEVVLLTRDPSKRRRGDSRSL